MDTKRSTLPQRLLAVGVTLVVLAGVQWVWAASTDREATLALGGVTGAIAVCVFALVWILLNRRNEP